MPYVGLMKTKAKGKPVGFDQVAIAYHLLERISFGSSLQRARTAHLKEIAGAEDILLVGEGNGLFLKSLLEANSRCRVTCLDASQSMLELSKDRIFERDRHRVHFRQTDLTSESMSANKYEVVVTHFFLDCFNRKTLNGLLPKLEGILQPRGKWLLADFVEPKNAGAAAFFQRTALRFLYLFFQVACGIEARSVHNPRDILGKLGLKETMQCTYLNGWITSLVYEKTHA